VKHPTTFRCYDCQEDFKTKADLLKHRKVKHETTRGTILQDDDSSEEESDNRFLVDDRTNTQKRRKTNTEINNFIDHVRLIRNYASEMEDQFEIESLCKHQVEFHNERCSCRQPQLIIKQVFCTRFY
jgi:hypothetical protein